VAEGVNTGAPTNIWNALCFYCPLFGSHMITHTSNFEILFILSSLMLCVRECFSGHKTEILRFFSERVLRRRTFPLTNDNSENSSTSTPACRKLTLSSPFLFHCSSQCDLSSLYRGKDSGLRNIKLKAEFHLLSLGFFSSQKAYFY